MTRALCALLAIAAGITAAAHAGEIDTDLANVLAVADPNESVSVIVHLHDPVDLDALGSQLAAESTRRPTRAERHRRVVTALLQRAALQAELRATLADLHASGAVDDFQPFWIINGIRVEARPDQIEQLAARDDVRTVFFDYPIELIAPLQPDPKPVAARSGTLIEPGILAVRAPEVWAEGITGTGVLVATLDTGVDGTHPALADRWRGNDPAYAGHPGWAFFDPVTNWTFPQDAGLHGTHTMGTVCGGAPGNQIGVAPGAEWISAAVIDRISGTQTVSDAILAFQWMLDPDGNPNTSWDVPQVCSNSWGIATGHNLPPYSMPCDGSFWSFIDASEAAGTVQLFSAGNEGPFGNSLRRPADRASDEYRNCAVGGINANDAPNWTMFTGSSRGPTDCGPGGQTMIKPDISAPGVNVISAFPGGGYGPLTGTSMASPHVNGVVALMLQVCPVLTPDEVKQVIYDTALDLGDPGKDNDSGYGLIDAYEAVRLAALLCSGVPLTEPAYLETAVEQPLTVTLVATDYDGLPDPPGALTYLITSLPEPGNTLTDPVNAHLIAPGDLPYTLAGGGNQVLYTPASGYYGEDAFQFAATDGGVPPDAGQSDPAEITILVKFGPPQITSTDLPNGLISAAFGPVQLQVFEGQPQLEWEVFLAAYVEVPQAGSGYATVGTPRGWQDDDASWTYTLPFAFPFFGEDYTDIHVCSNGFIDFASADTDPTNSVPEFLAAPRIAPFWEDLKTDAPGDIHIDDSVAGQVTVRWEALTYWGDYPCSFAVTLHQDGRIVFDYGPGNTGAEPTIGISAGDGVNYLLASYDTASMLDDAPSLEFEPPADLLPDGLTLSTAGLITGSPTVAGLFRPIFKVTDALGRSDQRQLDLNVLALPLPPTASDVQETTPASTPVVIDLPAADDGLPDPPATLAYRIESLPARGTIADPLAGSITGVPYVLAAGGNTVAYTPDDWEAGPDSFTFRANDGGMAPDGGDSNLATVSIDIEPPPSGPVYVFPLDQDPGWTTEGAWAYGQPTGGGSFAGDPVAGYTGAAVYGYNLAGDYANDLAAAESLTTAAIDCSNLFNTELRFRRWLGVERQPFDFATVSVSSDGLAWTEVWSNPLTNTSDSAWTPVALDISAVADGQPTVYVRWSIGPTDRSVTYPGWNIDDVEFWGWQIATCPGDADSDGDVDLSDLGIVLGQFGAVGAGLGGDLDRDGVVGLGDLSLVLANYGAACP